MKRKVLIAILAVLLVAVCLVGCTGKVNVDADVELVSNSNLEVLQQGALADWTLTVNNADLKPKFTPVSPAAGNYNEAYGTYSPVITALKDGVYATYSQTVAVQRHAVYRLSMDVKVNSAITAGGKVGAWVGLDGYELVRQSTMTAEGWHTVSVYFRNDNKDQVTVVWGLGSADSLVTAGEASFDNVSLVRLTDEEVAQQGIIAVNLRNANNPPYNENYKSTATDTIFVVLVVVLAAGLLVGAYFLLRYLAGRTNPTRPAGNKAAAFFTKPIVLMIAALLVGFAVRLVVSLTIFGYGAYNNGMMTAAASMAEKGLWQYYVDATTYYAPGATYIMYLLGLLAIPLQLVSGTQGMAIFMKIPAIIADLVLLAVVYAEVCRKYDSRTALVATVVLALCPVTFIASGVWGTFASVGVLFLVLAMLAVRDRKVIKLTVYYTLAVWFMPEALLLLPLLLVYCVVVYIKYADSRIKLPVAATVSIVASYALTVPLALNFIVAGRPFIVLERYCTYFAQNKYFARNLFSIYTMCGVGANEVNTAGVVMSALLAAVVMLAGIVIYLKRRNRQDIQLVAAWTLLGVLLLSAHMDLWLSLPVVVLLLVYSVMTQEKRVMAISGGLSMVYTVNAAYAMYVGGNTGYGIGSGTVAFGNLDPVAILFSVIAVVLFGLLTWVMVDVCCFGRKKLLMPLSKTSKAPVATEKTNE